MPQGPVKSELLILNCSCFTCYCVETRLFGSFFPTFTNLMLILVLPSPVRCLKVPSWVHYQGLPRRKKRPDPSRPEPGIPGWDELPARPGYSDGCAASFRSPSASWSAPPSTAAPSKVQIPDRIHCSTFRLVHRCSCKILASYRPFFPVALNCPCPIFWLRCRNSSSLQVRLDIPNPGAESDRWGHPPIPLWWYEQNPFTKLQGPESLSQSKKPCLPGSSLHIPHGSPTIHYYRG